MAYWNGLPVSMVRIVKKDIKYMPDQTSREIITKKDVTYVLGLFTHPLFREKGFASYLLDRIESQLSTQGITKVYVSAESTSQSLFQKQGYKKIGKCCSCVNYPSSCNNIPLLMKRLR